MNKKKYSELGAAESAIQKQFFPLRSIIEEYYAKILYS